MRRFGSVCNGSVYEFYNYVKKSAAYDLINLFSDFINPFMTEAVII